MAYIPPNINGQATMANSAPVVISSDQSAVPVSGTVTANIGTVATLATAAKQDTGNVSVASVDTKTPALGQALAASSTPVVLTAAQITTLTPQVNALTDTQLRATPVPVSGTVAVTGVATETTLAALNTKVATAKTFDLDSGAGTDTVQALGLAVAASGGSVAITGDAANGLDVDVTRLPALPAGTNNIGDVDVLTVNGVAPAFGTGLRGATVQRVTIATDDVVPVTGTFFQATQPVSAVSLPLPTGASTLAEQQTQTTVLGGVTETAPASDTASSGLNGRLQRIAQRITSLISLFPTALGQGTMATSMKVVLPSDQSAIPVTLTSTTVTNTVTVNDSASATGGYTPNKLISAATTNATVIKASAGTLGYVQASNVNAAARYLKFYNKATTPTVGTDVPVHVWLIPGNTAGAGTNIPIPSEGVNFSAGISFAITTGAADTDVAAVAASEIIVNYGTI